MKYVIREYQGEGYRARMGVALKQSDNTDARVVHQTAVELIKILGWPERQLSELQ